MILLGLFVMVNMVIWYGFFRYMVNEEPGNVPL